MKKYNWIHFSGQVEIVNFLNKPENKNIIPVSINNDNREIGGLFIIKLKNKKK